MILFIWILGLSQGYPYVMEGYPGQHLGYPLSHQHPHGLHQGQPYPLPTSPLPQGYPPHSGLMAHSYHLYTQQGQLPPTPPSQAPSGLNFSLSGLPPQPPTSSLSSAPSTSQSQAASYPPINYPPMPSSTAVSLPISTYIPPVQSYEAPVAKESTSTTTSTSSAPVALVRPTPFLAVERESVVTPVVPSSAPAPVTSAPHTPTSSSPGLMQPFQTSPVPPSPGMGLPPGHPDMEHDLPPELLQQGWRKFWSKRENRIYFWNKATGESLWEMPPHGRPSVSFSQIG